MSGESALWYSSLDGLSLFARRFGTGSRRAPLLCLHDVASTSRALVPFAQEISVSRKVLVPDLRGHGRSDYPFDLASYSLEMLAEDAKQLLEVEEIDHAVVLGSGLGGVVALQLAALIPRAVAAIILCECDPILAPQLAVETALRAELAASLGSWTQAEAALPGARGVLRDENGRPQPDWDPVAASCIALSLTATNMTALLETTRGKAVLALSAVSGHASRQACDAMVLSNSSIKCVNIPGISDARALDRTEIVKPIKAFLASLA